MTLQYNHRLPLKLTYNLSYLRMTFFTKDNQHATTSKKLWTLQLEILGEHLLQTRVPCNYNLIRLHKEKHNRFLTSYPPDIVTSYNSAERKHAKSQERNLVKLLQENEKLIIRNNEDLLSGLQRYYASGQHFALRTPYSIRL